MKKILLNKDYGCFDVSLEATLEYAKRKHLKVSIYKAHYHKGKDVTYSLVSYKTLRDNNSKSLFGYVLATKNYGRVTQFIPQNDRLDLDETYREDTTLIEIVEEMGPKASGKFGCLKVVEIPDELVGNYMIDNYDGIERLHQKVQEW